MAEIGIDISNQRSTAAHDVNASIIDLVITLCGEEVCPVVLSDAARLHWPLDDPDKRHMKLSEAQRLEYFRVARDEIERRIRALTSVSTDVGEGLGVGVGR
jgi:arsenate reductase